MQSLLGKKINQTQGFLEDGTRVPLSIISVAGNIITQIKTEDKEGYNSIQVGFGSNKRPSKSISGHLKKAGITQTPRFFREIRVDELPSQELGSTLSIAEIFEPGDIVDISGTSKGKGYAGVIKRHHFHGGPKTHGQSDRERAPGAIGQGTTPGRVYKGKKMSGNMGNDNVTIKNLLVLGIDGDTLLVKGLIPGVRGGLVMIKKVGTKKKFTPLFSKKTEEEKATEQEVETASQSTETTEETKKEAPKEEVKTADETVATSEEKVKTQENVATAEEKVVDSNEAVEAEASENDEKKEVEASETENVEVSEESSKKEENKDAK